MPQFLLLDLLNEMKKEKIIIVMLLIIGLFAWYRCVVLLGTLSHEDNVIKNTDGEIIYTRGDPPLHWQDDVDLFAGIVDGNGGLCLSYYMPGDIEREWLYVVGWRFQGFYQRAETAR